MLKKISKAYWLWFQFSNQDTKKLKKIKFIVNKSLKGPVFDIHLTLIGPFLKFKKKDFDKVNEITNKIKKFKVQLIKYSFENTKFTSLFIKVKKTKKLISIRDKYKKTNYLNQSSLYNPHISLFYGIKNDKIKNKIISYLPKHSKSATIDKLCIVDVNEKINKWKIIKKIELKNGKN
jgi:hypothetical protein